MYLDVHEHVRAWKGYPWDVLDVLHEHGLISDPKSKAKSVVLTQEGLAQAESAFNALLAIRKTPIPEPVQRPLAASGSGRLSELQLVQVDRLLAPICKPHPDPKVSSKVRLGYRIADYSVILFESRPAFMPPHDWLEQEGGEVPLRQDPAGVAALLHVPRPQVARVRTAAGVAGAGGARQRGDEGSDRHFLGVGWPRRTPHTGAPHMETTAHG